MSEFKVGDRVRDDVNGFGEGVVFIIEDGSSDYSVAVRYEESSRCAFYTYDGKYLYRDKHVSLVKIIEDNTDNELNKQYKLLQKDLINLIIKMFYVGYPEFLLSNSYENGTYEKEVSDAMTLILASFIIEIESDKLKQAIDIIIDLLTSKIYIDLSSV